MKVETDSINYTEEESLQWYVLHIKLVAVGG